MLVSTVLYPYVLYSADFGHKKSRRETLNAQLASACCDEDKSLDDVKKAIAAGAQVNSRCSSSLFLPLRYAAAVRKVALCKLLLEAKADPNPEGESLLLPLCYEHPNDPEAGVAIARFLLCL